MPRTADRTTRRQDELLDQLVELYLAEGFLRFGVGDLAARLRCSRSTLYLVAASKEQLVVAATRRFFRRAAERIEAEVQAEPDAGRRLEVYLRAVARELGPAGERFYADLAAFAPAAELYAENTRHAARRAQDLVAEGVADGSLRDVDPAFVGAAVAQLMRAIQAGAIADLTGLDDARAYEALADLLVHGLRRPGAR
ncbi:TetR/AcrR family transcriptional regulator [Nocardioides sp. SYSU D00038]|uniref:TetR/AcrR family transcriptional regulator n=1 Tax=Nocardioides sp. SYSU D00038 TaxID=2812554 RepID=UPI0019683F61|nr:TetR/AcrR family transcriptional regulator [Nocardioides sp. SYSU D00038]